jgi:hypothetical protein
MVCGKARHNTHTRVQDLDVNSALVLNEYTLMGSNTGHTPAMICVHHKCINTPAQCSHQRSQQPGHTDSHITISTTDVTHLTMVT